jgi:hypothetical protein
MVKYVEIGKVEYFSDLPKKNMPPNSFIKIPQSTSPHHRVRILVVVFYTVMAIEKREFLRTQLLSHKMYKPVTCFRGKFKSKAVLTRLPSASNLKRIFLGFQVVSET